MPADWNPAVMLLPSETYRRNMGSATSGGFRLSSLRQLAKSGSATSRQVANRFEVMVMAP
jgi:hypothetical protein